MGLSTAHYLMSDPAFDRNTTVTLVEGSDIAAGASGYAGGFLAKGDDWHSSETRGTSFPLTVVVC